MHAWQLADGFGRKNLRRIPHDPGAPGPGEARVRLTAWSLNYRDFLVIEGQYNPRQPLPLIPGSDAVGVVEEVGPGVTRVQVGDRVCPNFSQTWLSGRPQPADLRSALGSPGDGVFRDAVVLPEAGLVHPPAHLTDAECASLPCAAVTAWRALVTEGQVQPGDVVLTLGTGGVSLAALQIAQLMGARVAITSSSDEKLARARSLGATWTLNYRSTPSWGKALAKTIGEIDHVVEVGGAGTLDESLRAVRMGGTISLIGVLAGVQTPLALTKVLMRGIRVQGVFVGSRDDFEGLNRALVARPSVRPVVGRTFAKEDLPEALGFLESQQHFGKVALTDP